MAPVCLCTGCARVIPAGTPFEILARDEKCGRRYVRFCRTCASGEPMALHLADGWALWGGRRTPAGPYLSPADHGHT